MLQVRKFSGSPGDPMQNCSAFIAALEEQQPNDTKMRVKDFSEHLEGNFNLSLLNRIEMHN